VSKSNQKANQTENIQENVHKNKTWLAKARLNAKKKLTPKMFKLYCEYSDHLLLCSHSLAGRKKSLVQFVIIVNRFKIKDLTTITAEEIKQIVITIMVENSNNGKETWYSQDLKKQVRFLVRFAKTGSHYLADEGELPELRQIKCRAIADKLSREEMPTEADCREILNACDSPMDRAMLAVHMEAGTRVGELLTLQIKHVVLDEYGAMIAVDGKNFLVPSLSKLTTICISSPETSIDICCAI
jgi:integrase